MKTLKPMDKILKEIKEIEFNQIITTRCSTLY